MCEWIFTVLLNNTFACLALKQTLQGNNTRLLVEDSLVFQSNTIHFLNLECTTDRGLCCFPSAKVFHQFRRYTWLGDISKTSMPLGLSWSSRFQGRLWNLISKACTESISTTHYWKSLKNSKQLMKNPNFNLASHCESHFLNLNSLFKKKIKYQFTTFKFFKILWLVPMIHLFVSKKKYEYVCLYKLQNPVFILSFSGINLSLPKECFKHIKYHH